MFVRSSRYHELRVRLEEAEAQALKASAQARQAKVEIEQARRDAQESKDDYLHRLMFERIIVHTREHSVEGVLTECFVDSISLRQATMTIAPGSVETLEGEQIIPRAQVVWVQRLGNVRA